MVHPHIDATLLELVQHLVQSLLANLLPNSTGDPRQIVIALIGRPVVIISTQAILFQR